MSKKIIILISLAITFFACNNQVNPVAPEESSVIPSNYNSSLRYFRVDNHTAETVRVECSYDGTNWSGYSTIYPANAMTEWYERNTALNAHFLRLIFNASGTITTSVKMQQLKIGDCVTLVIPSFASENWYYKSEYPIKREPLTAPFFNNQRYGRTDNRTNEKIIALAISYDGINWYSVSVELFANQISLWTTYNNEITNSYYIRLTFEHSGTFQKSAASPPIYYGSYLTLVVPNQNPSTWYNQFDYPL